MAVMKKQEKKQRMADWRCLRVPKMPWETYKRLVMMPRFRELIPEERPEEVLKWWREKGRWDEIEDRIRERKKKYE